MREVGLKSDPEQAALGGGINREIKSRVHYHAIDDVLHFATGFLKNQEVAGAEESHAGWLVQSRDDCGHAEVGIDHRRSFRGGERRGIDSQRSEKPILFIVNPGSEINRGGFSRQTEAEL